MNNYLDGVVQQSKAADGRIYGICVSTLGILGYYNKEIFDRYNLEPPESWEEYLEVCEVLKKNGVVPQVQGGKDLWQNQFIVMPEHAMWLKDNNWVAGITTGASKYTDPEAVEVFKRMQTFVERGYLYEGSVGLTYMQAWQFFCEGNAAMMAGGSFFAAQVFPQMSPSFEWDLYNIPNNLKSRGQPNLMAFGIRVHLTGINKEGKHIEEALTFFEWLSQPENLAILSEGLKSFSAGKGITSFTTPVHKKIHAWMALQDSMPHVEAPGEIMNDRLKAMQDIMVGAKTAEEACAEIQSKIDAAFGLE
jgi:raffinose/stachyose/melibiose transport system substrate-binding protein